MHSTNYVHRFSRTSSLDYLETFNFLNPITHLSYLYPYVCSISGDNDSDVRERAVEIIKSLRAAQAYFSFIASMKKKLKEITTRRKIRLFRTPKIDVNAETYYQIFKTKYMKIEGPYTPPDQLHFPVHTMNSTGPLKYEPVTEPPMLRHLSVTELEKFMESPLSLRLDCHTQSVERGVALTSQSVKRRRKPSSQQRVALSTVAAREQFPEPITHKRFKGCD